MKKIFLNTVVSIFILSFFGSNIAFAEETVIETEDVPFEELVTPTTLSTEEKENLHDLGFSEEEVSTMTNEEFQQYEELDGELVNKTDKFYKLTTDINNVTRATLVTEHEALVQSGYLQETGTGIGSGDTTTVIKPPISIMSVDTNKNSWLKMTTSASKLSTGTILLKNSFVWLRSPNVTLTDVVGITHSASAVKVPGTESFAYKYTDGRGVHTLGSKSTVRNSTGIAKRFNLKGIGSNIPPYNHNGYISVQVKKGNKYDIRANAYGHYSHITAGITGATIGLTPGSMTIGVGATKTKIDDTMVIFNY